eukprot:s5471_g1.t1
MLGILKACGLWEECRSQDVVPLTQGSALRLAVFTRRVVEHLGAEVNDEAALVDFAEEFLAEQRAVYTTRAKIFSSPLRGDIWSPSRQNPGEFPRSRISRSWSLRSGYLDDAQLFFEMVSFAFCCYLCCLMISLLWVEIFFGFVLVVHVAHFVAWPLCANGRENEQPFLQYLARRMNDSNAKILAQIKKLAKNADVLINACDAGREGELIFRHIQRTKKPFFRLWLQSLTDDAIRHGMKNLRPGEEFDNLAAAAECRMQWDWLIGINSSRALARGGWLEAKTSVGRVMTPTLTLAVDREKALEASWAFP